MQVWLVRFQQTREILQDCKTPRFGWFWVVLLGAALTACKPREISVACPALPIVDGFETAMAEGGKMRLRVPAHSARLTEDCKHIIENSVTHDITTT